MSWCEVERIVRMFRQPIFYLLKFMDTEIIHNQMNLLVIMSVGTVNFFKKIYKLSIGMALIALPEDLSLVNGQRGNKRYRAVSFILKIHFFWRTFCDRFSWMFSAKCLQPFFFINANYLGIYRWIQIMTNNFCLLNFKVWIGVI